MAGNHYGSKRLKIISHAGHMTLELIYNLQHNLELIPKANI